MSSTEPDIRQSILCLGYRTSRVASGAKSMRSDSSISNRLPPEPFCSGQSDFTINGILLT